MHVPHHRVWDPVLEALPAWRPYRYIVGVVNSPVGARKDLLWHVRINDDRINRNIRKVACLIYPCEGAAVSSAGYLENVTLCRRRVSIKAAHRRVPHRQIGGPHGRVKRDT